MCQRFQEQSMWSSATCQAWLSQWPIRVMSELIHQSQLMLMLYFCAATKSSTWHWISANSDCRVLACAEEAVTMHNCGTIYVVFTLVHSEGHIHSDGHIQVLTQKTVYLTLISVNSDCRSLDYAELTLSLHNCKTICTILISVYSDCHNLVYAELTVSLHNCTTIYVTFIFGQSWLLHPGFAQSFLELDIVLTFLYILVAAVRTSVLLFPWLVF